MVLNGRAADPPRAAGFFLRLLGFLVGATLYIRVAYWLIGPPESFWQLARLVRLAIVGPFFVLAIYPIVILAYDTLTHFVPRPSRDARAWKEPTRRQAEANAAFPAFTSVAFTVIVLFLYWLIPRIEDPISLTMLIWTYRLALVCLALTAGAALLGFYFAMRRA